MCLYILNLPVRPYVLLYVSGHAVSVCVCYASTYAVSRTVALSVGCVAYLYAEAGKLSLEEVEFDPEDCVEDAIAPLTPLADGNVCCFLHTAGYGSLIRRPIGDGCVAA